MGRTTNRYSPEVRERAVRLVLDNEGQHGSRWQAVMSITAKFGCAPQTLNEWGEKAEVENGKRAVVSSEMAERMKALERLEEMLARPSAGRGRGYRRRGSTSPVVLLALAGGDLPALGLHCPSRPAGRPCAARLRNDGAPE